MSAHGCYVQSNPILVIIVIVVSDWLVDASIWKLKIYINAVEKDVPFQMILLNKTKSRGDGGCTGLSDSLSKIDRSPEGLKN